MKKIISLLFLVTALAAHSQSRWSSIFGTGAARPLAVPGQQPLNSKEWYVDTSRSTNHPLNTWRPFLSYNEANGWLTAGQRFMGTYAYIDSTGTLSNGVVTGGTLLRYVYNASNVLVFDGVVGSGGGGGTYTSSGGILKSGNNFYLGNGAFLNNIAWDATAHDWVISNVNDYSLSVNGGVDMQSGGSFNITSADDVNIGSAKRVVLGTNQSVKMPSGNTAQRSNFPQVGDTRWNTDSVIAGTGIGFEVYNGTAWRKTGGIQGWNGVIANPSGIPNVPGQVITGQRGDSIYKLIITQLNDSTIQYKQGDSTWIVTISGGGGAISGLDAVTGIDSNSTHKVTVRQLRISGLAGSGNDDKELWINSFGDIGVRGKTGGGGAIGAGTYNTSSEPSDPANGSAVVWYDGTYFRIKKNAGGTITQAIIY